VLVLIAAVVAVAALAAAAAWFFLSSQSAAASGLRDYVARQVVAIDEAYLVPSLDYDTDEYEVPGTFRFTGARLTSDDGLAVLDLDHLVIVLDEVPSPGKPIRVARVEIDGGRVRLVRGPGGRLRGLEPLVKGGVRDGTAEIPEEHRLSNVLRLEHVTVAGLALTYDDGSGAPPMDIAGFAADLDITPDATRGAGWYTMAADAGRSPGLTLDLEGAFNIDSLTADIDKGLFTIALDRSTVGSLPPRLQELIAAADASGSARIAATGTVPLEHFADADLAIDLALSAFNIAGGDYRLPIESLEALIDIADG
jgi:hypothetical protein